MQDIFNRTLQQAGAPLPSQEQTPDPTGRPQPGGRRPFGEMPEPELVKWNHAAFERGTGHRRHVERAGLLATAFLLDQHYVDFQGQANAIRLVKQAAKKGRLRTVEQIIEPAYRGEIARLLRTKPRGTVVPLGQDPEDVESAEAGDAVLSAVLRESGFAERVAEAVGWQVMCGNALLGTHWDENKRDRNGNQGVTEYRALGPFEFAVPQPRTKHLGDQPWVMVTKRYEVDEVEDLWGVRVSSDEHQSWGALDQRIETVIQGGTRSGSTNTDYPEVIVKETWVKPSPMAPAGMVLITGGDKLLDMQVWPEWCQERYPFEHLQYIPVPGSFWAKGFIQSLIPLQRRHNRAASTNLELMNMLSQLAVSVPRGTQVRQILGGRGALFETPPGATQPTSNVTPPPLGDLAYKELEHTRQAVRDISYQHEVSKGYTPPNVRSGTAISMLKEMDDSASSVPLTSIEQAVERAGEVTLQIVREKWQEPRYIRVLSHEGELEMVSFISGDDVGGQYFVQPGSSWPYTKAEKQGMVLQWYDRGLISPQEAIQYADIGTTSSEIRKERSVDLRQARRENQKFEALQLTLEPNSGRPVWNGEVPAPEDWHNHQAHLEEHQRIRKSPKYEKWPQHRKQAFEAHIMGHTAALYAQVRTQQQQQMAAQGGEPPRPPQAAGPQTQAGGAAQENDPPQSEGEE